MGDVGFREGGWWLVGSVRCCYFLFELNAQVDVFFLVASVLFWGLLGFCRGLVKNQLSSYVYIFFCHCKDR